MRVLQGRFRVSRKLKKSALGVLCALPAKSSYFPRRATLAWIPT